MRPASIFLIIQLSNSRAAEIGGLPGGQKDILSPFKLSGLVIY